MSKSVILAGCAPDTSNLGVSALCYSTVAGLKKLDQQLDITVLGHGEGVSTYSLSKSPDLSCIMLGAKNTKRIYKSSSFRNINMLGALPFSATSQIKKFKSAKAILDISGGDSFTDLYGEKRFQTIMYPKLLAKKFKKRLILLPQTYGPFKCTEKLKEASEILKYADLAFARDENSFQYMKKMLGESFDDKKHRVTTDLAFLMPAAKKIIVDQEGLLPKVRAEEVFGINVSGLIYNSLKAAQLDYNIDLDYRELLLNIVSSILNSSDGDIWLIPHVIADHGSFESDIDACNDLKSKLDKCHAERVKIISGQYDQCDIKGVIKACDWFVGTRMHSTIASLSCKIPTVGLAYSGKFQGVFDTVNQGFSVIDLRNQTKDKVHQEIMKHWNMRSEIAKQMNTEIPAYLESSKDQFTDIVKRINS